MSTIATDGLRRCKKCQTFYDERGGRTFCPADGRQHLRGDFDYQLSFNTPELGSQGHWRRCTR